MGVSASGINRLIYVDDSGSQQSGLAVYGWVEFAPERWAEVLGTWLDMRKRLWRQYSIPVVKELHTTEYVNGRARITRKLPDRYIHGGQEFWKDFGREVAVECLSTLRYSEGLAVGAVWRRDDRAKYSNVKQQTYAALIQHFERELALTDSLALVFMDGDGTDGSYRTAHRNLKRADRRVIEDPIHFDSRASQLLQMADHVAWSGVKGQNVCTESLISGVRPRVMPG